MNPKDETISFSVGPTGELMSRCRCHGQRQEYFVILLPTWERNPIILSLS